MYRIEDNKEIHVNTVSCIRFTLNENVCSSGGGLRDWKITEVATSHFGDFDTQDFVSGSEYVQRKLKYIALRFIVGQRCAAYFRMRKFCRL